jgi:hypothetical protein
MHITQGVCSRSGGWRTAVTRGGIGTGKGSDTLFIEHDSGSIFWPASDRRNGLKHVKIYFRSICKCFIALRNRRVLQSSTAYTSTRSDMAIKSN